MLKKLLLFVAIIIGSFVQSSPSQALSLINGQTHFYTVQFRSDSRAIVYAKFVFQNSSMTVSRDTYTFTLPDGISVENLTTDQILVKSNPVVVRCIKEPCPESLPADDTYSDNTDFLSSSSANYYDYYSPSYRYTSAYTYQPLSYDTSGTTYTLKLAHPIKPGKQGAILVTFTTDSYAKSMFGRFSYTFKTLKTDELIDNANVAIVFDQELYSRDVTQKRTTDSSSTPTINSGASTSSTGKSLDSLIGTIGRGGAYTRVQSRLLPGDIMSVSGVYATTPFMLYFTEIIVWCLVLIAVIAAAWVGRQMWHLRHPKSVSSDHTHDTQHAAVSASSPQRHLTSLHLLAVSAASAAGSIITVIIIIGLASLHGNSWSWSIGEQIVLTLYSLSALFMTMFAFPYSYLSRINRQQLFSWFIIHFVVITILTLCAMLILSAINQHSAPIPAIGTIDDRVY